MRKPLVFPSGFFMRRGGAPPANHELDDMASLVDYGSLGFKVIAPEPTADGAAALQANIKLASDLLEDRPTIQQVGQNIASLIMTRPNVDQVSDLIDSAIADLGLGTAATHAATDFAPVGNYVTSSGLSSTLANYSTTSATSSAITSALTPYVTGSSLTSTLASYITSSNFTWANLAGKPTFATIATSGSASDLTSGTVPTARMPSGIAYTSASNTFGANQTVAGSVTATSFVGSLAATNLTGTLADARLSSNVALLNGTNTFSGSNTFSQSIHLQGGATIGNAYGPQIQFNTSSAWGLEFNTAGGTLDIQPSDYSKSVRYYTGGYFDWRTSSHDPAMRLANNGNLLINTTTDSGSGAKLQVSGSIAATGNVIASNSIIGSIANASGWSGTGFDFGSGSFGMVLGGGTAYFGNPNGNNVNFVVNPNYISFAKDVYVDRSLLMSQSSQIGYDDITLMQIGNDDDYNYGGQGARFRWSAGAGGFVFDVGDDGGPANVNLGYLTSNYGLYTPSISGLQSLYIGSGGTADNRLVIDANQNAYDGFRLRNRSTGGNARTGFAIGNDQDTYALNYVVYGSQWSADPNMRNVAYVYGGYGIGMMIQTNNPGSGLGFFGTYPTVRSNGWSASNYSASKTLDASNATSVANVLATLILELRTKGLIGS